MGGRTRSVWQLAVSFVTLLLCISGAGGQTPQIRETVLTCINCNEITDVQITVTSFTFDTAQGQTLMQLSLDPKFSFADCSFRISFQDETGKMYQPGGQLNNGGRFTLVKGQRLKLLATYAFIPSSDSTYTLKPGHLSCTAYQYLYGDVQFTF